jgi:hypothetical protein
MHSKDLNSFCDRSICAKAIAIYSIAFIWIDRILSNYDRSIDIRSRYYIRSLYWIRSLILTQPIDRLVGWGWRSLSYLLAAIVEIVNVRSVFVRSIADVDLTRSLGLDRIKLDRA